MDLVVIILEMWRSIFSMTLLCSNNKMSYYSTSLMCERNPTV